jgi:hypothetical protein
MLYDSTFMTNLIDKENRTEVTSGLGKGENYCLMRTEFLIVVM